MKWNTHSKSVELSADLKLPQFTVERVETGHCEEGSLIGERAIDRRRQICNAGTGTFI